MFDALVPGLAYLQVGHNLKKTLAEMPAKYETEKEAAIKSVADTAAREKETALILIKKEMDAQKMVYEGQIKNQELLIGDQRAQIKELQTQLLNAQKQVQEVVLKSIEGASSSKAFDAVNKLAMEQVKSGSGLKEK